MAELEYHLAEEVDQNPRTLLGVLQLIDLVYLHAVNKLHHEHSLSGLIVLWDVNLLVSLKLLSGLSPVLRLQHKVELLLEAPPKSGEKPLKVDWFLLVEAQRIVTKPGHKVDDHQVILVLSAQPRKLNLYRHIPVLRLEFRLVNLC